MTTMTWTMGTGGGEKLPDGAYYAKFAGTEAAPPREYQGKMLEAGVRWQFELSRGPYKGRKAGPITGAVPGPGNACGRTLIGLLGRTPATYETVDLNALVGREYLLTISAGKVQSVATPPQQ